MSSSAPPVVDSAAPGGLPHIISTSVSSSSSSAVPPVGPKSFKLRKEDDSVLILSQDHVPHDADEAPRVPPWMRAQAEPSDAGNRLAQHRKIMLLPRHDCTFFNDMVIAPAGTAIKSSSKEKKWDSMGSPLILSPLMLHRSRSRGSKGSREGSREGSKGSREGSSRTRQDSRQRDEQPLSRGPCQTSASTPVKLMALWPKTQASTNIPPTVDSSSELKQPSHRANTTHHPLAGARTSRTSTSSSAARRESPYRRRRRQFAALEDQDFVRTRSADY
jgi:hypothetical protein